ncbi:MAG: glycogen synthase [Oscillospiraceae bacterium]|nr:glycogen synthase [Oscillospiraceae bacterium]
MGRKEKLQVLHVVSEVVPFLTTGGMGQVAGALTHKLAENYPNTDIRVITPFYAHFRDKYEPQMTFLGETEVSLAWRTLYCGIYEMKLKGVTFYFIDNRHYFDRDNAYGYFDDGERFAYFSKAVFSVIELVGFRPSIIHAHDWQTALVIIYLKTHFNEAYKATRTIFTIHNMEYQGKYIPGTLHDIFDLRDNDLSLVEYEDCINLMKGALVCSDKVTTVSPSYAREIQTSCGYGLERIIRENAYKLIGIINGIDTELYNPATDPLLKKKYSAQSPGGKASAKKRLQGLFNLPKSPRKMLICVVSRLVSHKGIDLITYILDDLLNLDIQFLLLGTGDHNYELFFEDKAVLHPGKVAVSIAFNPDIAGLIYAGADVLLMPSRSEPCGLSQMIACRYGTIPIVRKTGGLGDTIKDCRAGEGNGFVFDDYNAWSLLDTIQHALDLFAHHPDDWNNLIAEAMGCDFSWDISAREYLRLYEELEG